MVKIFGSEGLLRLVLAENNDMLALESLKYGTCSRQEGNTSHKDFP